MASDETIAGYGLGTIVKSLATATLSPGTETTVSSPSCVEHNNQEYMEVFRTIAALRSQLMRAKSDMEILERLRSQALANPLEYVESVVSGAAPRAPGQQDVVDIPSIDVEPYMSCASSESVNKYLRIVQPAMSTQIRRGGGLIGLRSAPVRASTRSSSYASGKSGKRAQRPVAAALGQLSGVTAVATPGYSPPPAKSQPWDDLGARQDRLVGGIVQSAPVGAFVGAGDLRQGIHVPVASRANTEPLHAPPTTAPTQHAETQPSTPTRRGKSQKTLTPQMLAGFRQQAAEESQHAAVPSDDDDYARFGTSVADEFAEPLAAQESLAAQEPPGNRHSGKSLLFSGIARPATKRGRGRPKKNAQPAPKTNKPKHRGPTRTESSGPKPVSYNQPWSDEEQTRLENLLLEYPEEEVANDRWRKISEALGTRTMRQVASRVQKYFIKLYKAGLPVPGRVPDTSAWTSLNKRDPDADHKSTGTPKRARRAAGSSTQKRLHVDFTSSEEEDDVDIDLDDDSDVEPVPDRKGKQVDRSVVFDDDIIDFGGAGFQLTTSSDSWANGSGANMASTSSAQTPALRSAKAVHLGYRCDSCFAEPIVGIRWHCLVCRGAQTVDLCDECREEASFETEWHSESHNFQPVRDAEMDPYYANEVAAPALHEYSYLA
ncbi:hypothetical protein EV181_003426 [Coemansia sp. RSA 532]|nr:hypothetical protein EV181_003426 [Coemansia sp. RSA 532]KAJ2285718.1 hypothetical protein IW141_005668 [Coemansia sp. RSA 355]